MAQQEQLSKHQWDSLPSEIATKTQPLVEAQEYDSAIFEAFKLVEAAIQRRIGSQLVGKQLLDEAFDTPTPKIRIGTPADYRSVKAMFVGALGFIRNDRAHKGEPVIPCRSLNACLWHLNHAALLLYLLSKDLQIGPRVITTSVRGYPERGFVELHGENLDSITRVTAGELDAPIRQTSPTLVEVALPAGYVGDIKVYSEDDLIDERYCDARPLYGAPQLAYQVLDVDVPLFINQRGTPLLVPYVGVLLRKFESGAETTQLLPTMPGRYKKGQFVGWGPWDSSVVVPEAWYRDSETGSVHYAWTWSALFIPDVVSSDKPKLGLVTVLPIEVSLAPGEVRNLSLRGIESLAGTSLEVDLSQEAKWTSDSARIASVDKRGLLRANRFGATVVRCTVRGFEARVTVQVETASRGSKSTYLEGLRHTQQIALDSMDNLYVTNQSNSVYRIQRAGGVDVALRLPGVGANGPRVDCIAIDGSDGVLLTAPFPRHVIRFGKSGESYARGEVVGPDDDLTKRSVAVDGSGNVVVGIMGARPGLGAVCVVAPNGHYAYFRARDTAHNLAVTKDSRIYVSAPRFGAIDVYDLGGANLGSIDLGSPGPVGAVLAGKSGDVYVAMFNAGLVLRVSNDGGISHFAEGVGNPSGLAEDSCGNVFVSDFLTGRVYLIRSAVS